MGGVSYIGPINYIWSYQLYSAEEAQAEEQLEKLNSGRRPGLRCSGCAGRRPALQCVARGMSAEGSRLRCSGNSVEQNYDISQLYRLVDDGQVTEIHQT